MKWSPCYAEPDRRMVFNDLQICSLTKSGPFVETLGFEGADTHLQGSRDLAARLDRRSS